MICKDLTNYLIKLLVIDYLCMMQFKKHISLFIALILLVSNSGLAFNVHFCEGKIASISSIFSKEEVCKMLIKKEKACCVKLESSHKKCCSDKKVNLKNKTEKSIIKTISFDLDSFYFCLQRELKINNFTQPSYNYSNVGYSFNANAPPLYKLYCQFTLFG